MLRKLVVVAAAVALSGCAMPMPEVSLTTPSGHPEAVFKGATTGEISGKLAAVCADRGHLVTEATPNMVVCQVDLKGFGSLLLQETLGNASSTPVVAFVRFSVFEAGGNVRVQAYEWVETTMVNGVKHQREVLTPEEMHRIQGVLDAIGGISPYLA